jgi:hypothetical protein
MDKLSIHRCIDSQNAAPWMVMVSLLLVILMHGSLASAQENSSRVEVSSSPPLSVEFPAGSIILKAGQSKVTVLGTLVMQSDGNLVFYDVNRKQCNALDQREVLIKFSKHPICLWMTEWLCTESMVLI